MAAAFTRPYLGNRLLPSCEVRAVTRRRRTWWLHARRGAALAVSACALEQCAFPSDQGSDVSVSIDSPGTAVVRGDQLQAQARAWSGANTEKLQPVRGASFVWSSSDVNIARVTGQDGGKATISGVNPGRVVITAVPADFEAAQPGILNLRVTNSVEVDSVTPDTAHYGDQLTVYGVGLGSLARVTLGEINLIADPGSFTGDSAGLGSKRFWVPYPAVSDRALAIGPDGATPAPKPTIVIPTDVYDALGEPIISVALPPAADLAGGSLFTNPALAITGPTDEDAFRFVAADTGRPVSFVISAPGLTGLAPVLSPDRPIGAPFRSGSESWSWGLRSQFCKLNIVEIGPPLPPERAPMTVVRAFRRSPAQPLLFDVTAGAAGRYSLTVEDRYMTADPEILPDPREDDDTCVDADRNFTDPSKQVVVEADHGFSELLTLDNPFDVDWLRVRLVGEGTQLVVVRIAARPLGVADSSDLGLMLGAVPPPFFPEDESILSWLAESHGEGSNETILEQLSAGDYYLVVGDDIGVATPYALCVAVGSDCSLPP
jgi:hypothetical protein